MTRGVIAGRPPFGTSRDSTERLGVSGNSPELDAGLDGLECERDGVGELALGGLGKLCLTDSKA